jgi:hypothetical protein
MVQGDQVDLVARWHQLDHKALVAHRKVRVALLYLEDLVFLADLVFRQHLLALVRLYLQLDLAALGLPVIPVFLVGPLGLFALEVLLFLVGLEVPGVRSRQAGHRIHPEVLVLLLGQVVPSGPVNHQTHEDLADLRFLVIRTGLSVLKSGFCYF